jgi:hypothetical protein
VRVFIIKNMIKTCEECSSIFSVNEFNKRNKSKRFCGRKCSGKFNGKTNIGRNHSENTKLILSEKNKGEKNHFYGKKHSKKTINLLKQKLLWKEDRYKYSNLSTIENEILDGIMLSDGCLSEHTRISSRLTFGFKYYEMVELISNSLSNLKFSLPYLDKNTNCWHSKSKSFHDLLYEHNRWYLEKRKIVPKDIKITSISCYWWYIGDGYLSKDCAFLCTDSFTKDENLFLIKKLKKCGFESKLSTRNRIYFSKKESIRFLNWLKNDNNIINVYKYKWNLEKNV